MSGLAAAHVLQDAGYSVTLFEQGHTVGGRATTCKRDGFIYDSGAQYIKGGSLISDALITGRFHSDNLLTIAKPVWIFDAQGNIAEGDHQQNADPRWNYRNGLITLAQRMAAYLTIQFGKAVSHVEQTDAGWQLYEDAGKAVGEFERLLITIPAPGAVELIQFSQIESELQNNMLAHLQQTRYNPLLSVALGYSPTPTARPYYALVNTDKGHPISWLAWEHEKSPTRVPAGTGLLIAQMAPHYSRDHWQEEDGDIVQDVAHRVATLVNEGLAEPVFTDIQRWPYALPSERADADALNARTLPYCLAFCGDGFVGGRVHLALEHGIAVAKELS